MSPNHARRERFEQVVRSIVRKTVRKVARSAVRRSQDHVQGIAEAVGVDPARAQQWFDRGARWLDARMADDATRQRGPKVDDAPPPPGPKVDEAPPPPGPKADDTPPSPLSRVVSGPPPAAGPHTRYTPTAEQGVALAALDSGRWSVEPDSNALSARGHGPGPSDAIGVFVELRARDWITDEGAVTVAGCDALGRWLDAGDQH